MGSTSHPLSATHSWNHSKIDLRLAELRVLSSNKNIAHHGKFRSSTKSISIHTANQGSLELHNVVPPGQHIGHVSIWELAVLHFLDVSACSKGFNATSQNDGMDGWIFVKSGEGTIQVLEKCVAKSV